MPTRLLIIGGVAGGATAAARARRLDERAEIVLFERGAYISFANCGLPYYIGEVIPDRDDLLVTTPEAFRERYRIDIRIFSEVTAIDRAQKCVHVKNLQTGAEYREPYDRIILAPGAEPIRPPLENIDLPNIFNLRNIPDSDRIKAFIDQRQPRLAVVVGAGFIGLEMVENLVERGVQTIIVEMLDQVMPPLDPEMASIIQAYLKEKGIECRLGQRVTGFEALENRMRVATDKGLAITCDLVILSIGVRPENNLARSAGLELCERGHIRVNAAMQTSDPDIYAVGDAVCIRDRVTGLSTNTALAGPANKQGRVAADNAMGRRSLFRGTLGTAVVKIFDLVAASTGAGQKQLERHGIPHEISFTHSGSHASYYPGAEPMAIKLIFAPGTGRVLGGQIVGQAGVDKRIDVLATAIHGAMTVFDLEELELAYAPPFSSAKDPINIAGFVAANLLKGDVANLHWSDIAQLDPARDVLIDLRDAEELEISGRIKGALHIPLNQLRDRLGDLDRAKNYVPFCAVGLRGYLGHRILTQHGFNSRNLSGGIRTYLGSMEKIMQESPALRLWLSE